MTPEAQRIAIAEACGWKWYRRPSTGPWAKRPMRSLYHPELMKLWDERWQLQLADMTEIPCNHAFIVREGCIPDYPNDINAMRSAVLTLPPDKQADFIAHLWGVLGLPLVGKLWTENGCDGIFRCLTANVYEIAEAFLRTIGKWTE